VLTTLLSQAVVAALTCLVVVVQAVSVQEQDFLLYKEPLIQSRLALAALAVPRLAVAQ